jgi:hypothetical protein
MTIDKATQTPQGAHHDSNDVTITGNTTTYALRKLRKDSPQIHAEVVDPCPFDLIHR